MESKMQFDENEMNRCIILKDLLSIIPNILSGNVSISSNLDEYIFECKMSVSTTAPVLKLVYKIKETETSCSKDENIISSMIVSAATFIDANCPVFLGSNSSEFFLFTGEALVNMNVKTNLRSLTNKSLSFKARNGDERKPQNLNLNIIDDLFSIVLNILSGTSMISSVTSDSSLEYKIRVHDHLPILILAYVNIPLKISGILNVHCEGSSPPTVLDKSQQVLISRFPSLNSYIDHYDAESSYNQVTCGESNEDLLIFSEDKSFLNKIENDPDNNCMQEKLHKCKYCEKCFSTSARVKEHERIHTGERPFECTYCEKTFVDGSQKRRHERTHTGEKPYKCHYCDKSFSQSGQVKEHENRHTGVKPFKCSYCGKAFPCSRNVKQHERVHTGEKPYSCKYCEKTFSTPGSLKDHERTHTGEKPYACRYCKKSFSTSGSAKLHERLHTGEKPYKCRYCEKPFTDLSHAKYHESTHQCKYCGQAFPQLEIAKYHERLHVMFFV